MACFLFSLGALGAKGNLSITFWSDSQDRFFEWNDTVSVTPSLSSTIDASSLAHKPLADKTQRVLDDLSFTLMRTPVRQGRRVRALLFTKKSN